MEPTSPTFITVEQCSSDFERQTIATLAALSVQMTSLLGNGQPGRITRLEDRVGRIERWQWKIVGASSACGAIVGVAVTVVSRFIGH